MLSLCFSCQIALSKFYDPELLYLRKLKLKNIMQGMTNNIPKNGAVAHNHAGIVPISKMYDSGK